MSKKTTYPINVKPAITYDHKCPQCGSINTNYASSLYDDDFMVNEKCIECSSLYTVIFNAKEIRKELF